MYSLEELNLIIAQMKLNRPLGTSLPILRRPVAKVQSLFAPPGIGSGGDRSSGSRTLSTRGTNAAVVKHAPRRECAGLCACSRETSGLHHFYGGAVVSLLDDWLSDINWKQSQHFMTQRMVYRQPRTSRAGIDHEFPGTYG